MSDRETRALVHTFFDALERTDLATIDRCYAPDFTMWVNVTGASQTRDENLATLEAGAKLHRRRTYDDRQIHTWDDGFLVQYTCNVVTHGGKRAALSSCLVGEVRDGRISTLWEYLDSGRFRRG